MGPPGGDSGEGTDGDMPWWRLRPYLPRPRPLKDGTAQRASIRGTVRDMIMGGLYLVHPDSISGWDAIEASVAYQHLNLYRFSIVLYTLTFIVFFCMELAYLPERNTASCVGLIIIVALFEAYVAVLTRRQRLFVSRACVFIIIGSIIVSGIGLIGLEILRPAAHVGPFLFFLFYLFVAYTMLDVSCIHVLVTCSILSIVMIICIAANKLWLPSERGVQVVALFAANILGSVSSLRNQDTKRVAFMQTHTASASYTRLQREKEKTDELLKLQFPAVLTPRLDELGLLIPSEVSTVPPPQPSSLLARPERVLSSSLSSINIIEPQSSDPSAFDEYPEACILVAEVDNFQKLTQILGTEGTTEFLNRLYSMFERTANVHQVEKIKTVGPRIILASGLTATPNVTPMLSLIACGVQIMSDLVRIADRLDISFEMRAGAACGRVLGGILGTRRAQFDLWGMPVDQALCLMREAPLGRLLVLAQVPYIPDLKGEYLCNPGAQVSVPGLGPVPTLVLIAGRRPCTPPELDLAGGSPDRANLPDIQNGDFDSGESHPALSASPASARDSVREKRRPRRVRSGQFSTEDMQKASQAVADKAADSKDEIASASSEKQADPTADEDEEDETKVPEHPATFLDVSNLATLCHEALDFLLAKGPDIAHWRLHSLMKFPLYQFRDSGLENAFQLRTRISTRADKKNRRYGKVVITKAKARVEYAITCVLGVILNLLMVLIDYCLTDQSTTTSIPFGSSDLLASPHSGLILHVISACVLAFIILFVPLSHTVVVSKLGSILPPLTTCIASTVFSLYLTPSGQNVSLVRCEFALIILYTSVIPFDLISSVLVYLALFAMYIISSILQISLILGLSLQGRNGTLLLAVTWLFTLTRAYMCERNARKAWLMSLVAASCKHSLKVEETRAHNRLNDMVPKRVIHRLIQGNDGIAHGVHAPLCTVIVIKVGHTPAASIKSSYASARGLILRSASFSQYQGIWTPLLWHKVFAAFDHLLDSFPSVDKIRANGDTYVLVSGITDFESSHALNAARAALELYRVGSSLLDDENARSGSRLCLRVGLHSGPASSGMVGWSRMVYEVWGRAIDEAGILCREDFAKPSEEGALTRSMSRDRMSPLLSSHSPSFEGIVVSAATYAQLQGEPGLTLTRAVSRTGMEAYALGSNMALGGMVGVISD